MRITIGGIMALLLLSCLELTSAATNELIYGGDSYTANTSGNKTVVLEWALNDSGSSHTIRCTADPTSDINPSLKWWRLEGYDLTEDMNIPNAVVDTSNPKDIAITFTLVNYNSIGDYYCISTDSTPSSKAPANETNFRVRVSEYRSGGVVATWTLLIILFTGGMFLICKKFRLNEFSTRIDF